MRPSARSSTISRRRSAKPSSSSSPRRAATVRSRSDEGCVAAPGVGADHRRPADRARVRERGGAERRARHVAREPERGRGDGRRSRSKSRRSSCGVVPRRSGSSVPRRAGRHSSPRRRPPRSRRRATAHRSRSTTRSPPPLARRPSLVRAAPRDRRAHAHGKRRVRDDAPRARVLVVSEAVRCRGRGVPFATAASRNIAIASFAGTLSSCPVVAARRMSSSLGIVRPGPFSSRRRNRSTSRTRT
jgi:hypothetical protein